MNTAVITGDIINSRKVHSKWLDALKAALNRYAREPAGWEVFRGDSFQLEIREPGEALEAAIYIKACLRQYDQLDVRMAIGIGDKSYAGKKITESNGTAFIYSGEGFESLKKRKLTIKSSDNDFDEKMNLYFDLAALTMDKWSKKTALTLKSALENPAFSQIELAKLLKTTQSNISETLTRGGFEPLTQMIQLYKKKVDRI